MKLVVVAALLELLVQSFDCAPLSVNISNQNGHETYTIDGKPATEEEAKAALGQNLDMWKEAMHSTINGLPRTPEAELNNDITKQMENAENQMLKVFAPIGKPGWPNQQ